MCTRSGAHLRSASLPPPASPSFVSQACKVREISFVPESADASVCGQGFEQGDEPAVCICNLDGDEVRKSSCPSSKEDKEALRQRTASWLSCLL